MIEESEETDTEEEEKEGREGGVRVGREEILSQRRETEEDIGSKVDIERGTLCTSAEITC